MTTAAATAGAAGGADAPRRFGWLMSPRADFWLATSGGSLTLIVLIAVLKLRGWRELDVADFLLAELHLGATFDAIARRRLWRAMPWDVVAVPVLILAATYALILSGNAIFVTTVLAYLSVWHRGRQNFGLGKWYQRAAGGVVDRTHDRLFLAVMYLPMAASVLFYTRAYPTQYEGGPYHALVAPPWATFGMGALALLSVLAYFAWAGSRKDVHPAERWLVLSHVVAFGSAYFLGAWDLSFIIVIAIHHEIQYLFFAYAIARRQAQPPLANRRDEVRLFASFAVWPVLGLGLVLLANATGASASPYLLPSFAGILLGHYWLDGRIWTRRASSGGR